jgi:hypothetical protein
VYALLWQLTDLFAAPCNAPPPLDETGALLDLTQRQAEITCVLELFKTLGHTALTEAVESFAHGLKGYWGYYERLAVVNETLCAQHPRAAAAADSSASRLRHSGATGTDRRGGTSGRRAGSLERRSAKFVIDRKCELRLASVVGYEPRAGATGDFGFVCVGA